MIDIYSHLKMKDGARHTSLNQVEAEWLSEFVRQHKPRQTLEIGLAFGVSAVYIMSATGRVHYIIDPFVNSAIYQGYGLKNLARFGLKRNAKIFNEPSQLVLPRLLDKGLNFDFAFVDGSHFFDDQFVDFYFLDRLLKIGGHMIQHDAWTGPTKTLAAWIATNKTNYQTVDSPQKTFNIWQKTAVDKRKWFQFKKFKVTTTGKISSFI